jgi:hypothetical protein
MTIELLHETSEGKISFGFHSPPALDGGLPLLKWSEIHGVRFAYGFAEPTLHPIPKHHRGLEGQLVSRFLEQQNSLSAVM